MTGRYPTRAALRAAGFPDQVRVGRDLVSFHGAPMTDEALARIALDNTPGVGDEGVQAVLGPWTDELDLRQHLDRRVWTAAVAAMIAVFTSDDGRSALRVWQRMRTRPDTDDRHRAIAVVMTPVVPWRIEGSSLVPLVPVDGFWVPQGPLDLSDVGGVDGPPQDGGLLLARWVPGEPGWLRTAFALPRCPAPERLEGWWLRWAGPDLIDDPAIQREVWLARAGHHLIAEAHRWWWTVAHADDQGLGAGAAS